MMLEQPDYSKLLAEMEYYRTRCSQMEARCAELEAENKQLREELQSLKATVSAVVARSVGAKPATKNRRHKKPGRKKGHKGVARKWPVHIDARVVVDQSSCNVCGKSTLSREPTDSYKRVVTDIVPARPVVTEYTINRRYCSTCKKQVSPPVPGVLPNEVFGLRLMLLIVSLKLLGLSYDKICDHFRLQFNLYVTDVTINGNNISPCQCLNRRVVHIYPPNT